MTTSEGFDALQRLAERSLEGHDMATQALERAGIDAWLVRDLESEGLVEVRDQNGQPTVTLTDAGLSVLTPHNSA